MSAARRTGLLLLAAVVACGEPAPVAGSSDNVLLLTVCGLQQERLERACDRGDLPALARLRSQAHLVAGARASSSDCAAAHRRLLAADAPLAEELAGRGYACAAFLSRSELDTPELRRGFAPFDPAPIDRFAYAVVGPDAASPRLRRAAVPTAEAAVAWLAQARPPWFLWVQWNASAGESDGDDAEIDAAVRANLRALDDAVAQILVELARGGRDARTTVLFTADHGEELGERGGFGWRDPACPAVADVPLWIATPPASPSADPAGVVTAVVAALTPVGADAAPTRAGTVAAPAPATPLPRWVVQCRVPMPAEAARRLLPGRRAWVEAHPDDVAANELYFAALHALPDDAPEFSPGSRGADDRRLTAAALRADASALLLSLAARPDFLPDVAVATRLGFAERAVALAPWYFPAVRALAGLEQRSGNGKQATQRLAEFGATAPLAPAARAEFEQRFAATSSHLGGR